MPRSHDIEIDDEIRPYLNEIAQRLWSTPSHAAILVGSGFSKNSNKDFPDWEALGDILFEKIHGRKPDRDGKKDRYLNALKLADEVQAAFGRPVLDQLIRSSIPDDSSEPSLLHTKLLELPWCDVFTTNYDTLLERARNSIPSRKYDLVLRVDDLVYSESPRIIKLHGSFSSIRPFIITEEDYRTYPKQFAPFVNTVQQSLLENTLCLIGFSGDDPNFLQWIGWIRDYLGSANSTKMYLIGIFSLSEPQKKLLDQRNITLVDLGNCPGVNGSHYKAISRFIDYLNEEKTTTNLLGWPTIVESKHFDTDMSDASRILEITEEWREVRSTYPGWVFLPYDQRESLWASTRQLSQYVSKIDSLPEALKLTFAFELDWRLRRCLRPLSTAVAGLFESVIEEQKFANAADSTGNHVKDDSGDVDRNDIQNKLITLSLSLLRFYREEGRIAKWEELNEKLSSKEQELTPSGRAFLHYERSLYSLFNLDLGAVKSELQAWPKDTSLPFWEAKKAGVMAEIGMLYEAREIVDNALDEIRTKLNARPMKTDYSSVSEEATVMILAMNVMFALRFEPSKTIERDEYLDQRKRHSERWSILKRYQCDPWVEIKLFENALERPQVIQRNETRAATFDIDKVQRSFHFYDSDPEASIAQSFLRYFEESGFPFRIQRTISGVKAAIGALQRISKCSPAWAMATIIRTGDPKAAERVFDRQSLVAYSVQDVDELIVKYLASLERIDLGAIADGKSDPRNFVKSILSVVPEILSRLCCKCSEAKRLSLLRFLVSVYSAEHKKDYGGIQNLLRRLMDSLSIEEQYQIVSELIKIPYPGNIDVITEREFPNPFDFLRLENEIHRYPQSANIDQEILMKLMSLSSSETQSQRTWALNSLIHLQKLRLLTKEQERDLVDNLWARTDESGFPSDTAFRKVAFLDFPHPVDISPKELIRLHIKNSSFPIQSERKKRGIPMIDDIPLCHEIVGANKSIQWSKEEIDDILMKLIRWWNADKGQLLVENTPLMSTSGHFKWRFGGLINVLVRVALPGLERHCASIPQQEEIEKLIYEFSEYGLPTVRVEAAAHRILNIDKDKLSMSIQDALRSDDDNLVKNGLWALESLVTSENEDSEQIVGEAIILLSSKIHWRHQAGLVSALIFVRFLLDKRPDYFTEDLETSVLFALDAIESDTSLKSSMPEADFMSNLGLRKETAGLANKLYEFYSKKRVPIPKEVLNWEDVCSSEDEFAEVRIEWRTRNA